MTRLRAGLPTINQRVAKAAATASTLGYRLQIVVTWVLVGGFLALLALG